MDDDKQPATPARDNQDAEEFDNRDQTVSDQSGETAPSGADEDTEGDTD